MKRLWIATLSLLFLPALAGAVPIDFQVDAFLNSSNGPNGENSGLDTGIHFDLGDFFAVQVDLGDLWNAGALPRWSNADGLSQNLDATGTDDSGEPAGTHIGADFGLWSQHGLSLPYGTLVGSINGSFFAIGTNFAGVAPGSGNLLLYYWDSNFGDNTEFITAWVDAAPVPEPGASASWRRARDCWLGGPSASAELRLSRVRPAPQGTPRAASAVRRDHCPAATGRGAF